jgi:hypothetical protein
MKVNQRIRNEISSFAAVSQPFHGAPHPVLEIPIPAAGVSPVQIPLAEHSVND